VYGLAGNALDPVALARIFEVKNRPYFDPLIVHVGGRAEVTALCRDIPADAEILMTRFWPGPLTLVLPKTDRVPDLATAGLPSVAVRVPAHPVAQALLRAAGIPLAAPSANPFGGLSPTTAAHVANAFAGGINCVFDGGACAIGVESTVVGWDPSAPVLLRAGGIPLDTLEATLGKRVAVSAGATQDTGAQASPGSLASHYAPRTPLRLIDPNVSPEDSSHALQRAGLLWFGSGPVPGGYARVENLSGSGELREAAANLFAALHRLDAAGLERIVAVAVPDTGLGRAINDRLRKAAAQEEGRKG
jgi:L-threonylcarbamoyladenylate synthase